MGLNPLHNYAIHFVEQVLVIPLWTGMHSDKLILETTNCNGLINQVSEVIYIINQVREVIYIYIYNYSGFIYTHIYEMHL